jgi:uncharacterized protein YcbK (DUF882 family)
MLTKYFKAEELLPKGVTDTSLLDPKLLQLIDEIRELLGVPCTINNYASGGTRQWCGLRTPACTIGAPKSQHRLGKAADIHPIGMTAEQARAKVKKAVAEGKLKNLGGVEDGVSWLHVDVRPRVKGQVKWFTA